MSKKPEFEHFFEYLRNHASEINRGPDAGEDSDALIPVSRVRRTDYTSTVIDDE